MTTLKETLLQHDSQTKKFSLTILRTFITEYMHETNSFKSWPGIIGNGGILKRTELYGRVCGSLNIMPCDYKTAEATIDAILPKLLVAGVIFAVRTDVFNLTLKATKEIEKLQEQQYAPVSKTSIENILKAFDDIVVTAPLETTTEATLMDEESNTMNTETENTEEQNSINIDQLVADVIAASHSNQTSYVPAQLLADLSRAVAISPTNAASQHSLNWPVGSYKNSADFLYNNGLANSQTREITHRGNTAARRYGLWLTDLGIAVLTRGEFEKNYPELDHSKNRWSAANIEKGAKKISQPVPEPRGPVLAVVKRPDGSEVVVHDHSTLRMLIPESAPPAAEPMPPPAAPVAPVVPVANNPPKHYVLRPHRAIGIFIAHAIEGIFKGVAGTCPGADNIHESIDCTNPHAVAVAINKFSEILEDYKRYFLYCWAHDLEIDLDFLAAYRDVVIADAANIVEGKKIHVMNFPKVPGHTRAAQHKENAVKMVKWENCREIARFAGTVRANKEHSEASM